MENRTDEEIITSVQSGVISDFEVLVKRYEKRIFSYVCSRIGYHHDAWDITQNTFIRVYKHIGGIDTKRRFSAYLFTVAYNECITYFREQKQTVPFKADLVVQSDNDLYDAVEKVERTAKVDKILQRLPETYKTVLRLYYYSQLSYEEIARKLSISINTVRTRIRRGKQAFRKAYGIEKK